MKSNEAKSVSLDLLLALASTSQEGGNQSSRNDGVTGRLDVQAYLYHYGVPIKKIKAHGSSTLFIIEKCLFDPSHSGGESAIGQTMDGKLFYQCFHNSCQNHTWHEARRIISGNDPVKHFALSEPWQSSKNAHPTKSSCKDASNTGLKQDLDFRQLPPPFPIDIFPERCQKAILEIQRAYAVPVEIPAVGLISEGGACIGRTRGIRIKKGWVEHANSWFGIVGDSGLGKSPVVRVIQRPVFAAESKWYAEYQEASREYEREIENRKSTPKKDRGQLGPPPDPPTWEQLIVDDTTTEALTDALEANSRGILWNRDELAGLILELDKYSGKDGGTKSRLMSSYDSGPWKVNRKDKSKKAFIPHATLSIFGTIQPKALPTIFSNLDAATGFLPRFIFINASREAPPLWTDETVSDETHKYLASLVEGLLSFGFDKDGGPLVVGVSPEAKTIYKEWFNMQAIEPWVDTEAEIYEAVLAKLRGQCLRMSLILHCIEAVTTGSSELAPVSYRTMKNAIRLADYFKAHQKNAWHFVTNPGQLSELASLPKRITKAIVVLESEIKGGMLQTARIAQEINKGVDPKFHISVEAVGKAASNLGLKPSHLPDKSARAVVITEPDLNKFKSLFRKTVRSVRSVQNPDNMGSCGQNQTALQSSEESATETDGRTDRAVADGSEMGGEPDRIRSSDSSNSSDGSVYIFSADSNRLAAWDKVMSQVVGEAVLAVNLVDLLKEGAEVDL